MNIQPQQPISDDQELAKVLAGITAGADAAAADLSEDIEEEVEPKGKKSGGKDAAHSDDHDMPPVPAPDSAFSIPAPADTPASMPPLPAANTGLEAIKHDALNELRPLVDKLNLSAEEKFDTYLLIIRSTDDSTLVAPAFEAARAIADEAGRAQALFEIVKEIDYLSNPQRQSA